MPASAVGSGGGGTPPSVTTNVANDLLYFAYWQGNTGATATTPWTDMGIGAFEFTTGFDAASGTVTGQSVNLSAAGFFFCIADALVPGP